MRGFVLQDWVTIRGATSITQVIQNETNWLSLEAYQDAIFWLQAPELTVGGGTVKINYETAPIKDETLFWPMGTASGGITVIGNSMTPQFTQVILSTIGSTGTPLSRWVRWRLTNSATGVWDITFRVLVSCNQLFAQGGGGGAGGGFGFGTGAMR